MADPIIRNLTDGLWPNEPIYLCDQWGKFITPPQMSPAWVNWFQSMFWRVGGSSGDIIYNSVSGPIMGGDTDLGIIQRVNELESYVRTINDMSTAPWQEIEKIIEKITAIYHLAQDSNATQATQQVADLESKVNALIDTQSPSTRQDLIDLESKVNALIDMSYANPQQIQDAINPAKTTVQVSFDFDDTSLFGMTLPPFGILDEIDVLVDEAFDGTAPTVEVIGDGSPVNTYLLTTASNLTVLGGYSAVRCRQILQELSPVELTVIVDPDGSSTGSGRVLIKYYVPRMN